MSIDQAAKLMSVSAPSVKRAKKRKAADPQAHESIKRGEKPPKEENKDMRKGNNAMHAKDGRVYWRGAATEGFQSGGGGIPGNTIMIEIKARIMASIEWFSTHDCRALLTPDQADQIRAVAREVAREKLGDQDQDSAPKNAPIAQLQEDAESEKRKLLSKEVSSLDRAIAAHKRLLDQQMEERIKERLQSALDMYVKEYDRYKEFNDAWKGLLTDDEYRLVISCLHPDRAPADRIKQYEKAFHIIKSKEDVLLAAKQEPKQTTMPRTVEELMARRKQH
jgi:hypothetical protein